MYYSLPFFRYFGQFEKYFKYYLNQRMNFTRITDRGGSFDKNVLTKAKFAELVKKRSRTRSSFNLDKKLLAKFNELLATTDRKIVLVISPYHRSCFRGFINIKAANQFLNALNSINNVYVADMRDCCQ